VIIFMGVAGSGKSMQGKMLADHMGLPWLSTGEFLRMLISGERRKEMLQGKLLEDQEIISLVQKMFTVIDPTKQFVLDGFPRTVAQADWLLNQVKHQQLPTPIVVHLKASEEVVRARLSQRGRQDDNDEAIAERFREYEEAAKPILEHFAAANVAICDIDAERDVEEVQSAIAAAVKQHA
jgi:adenylate kinase